MNVPVFNENTGFDEEKTLSKSDVGLGNVDNTSDTNKPISSAVQTALNAKITGVLVTSVSDPGSDTNVPSEQVVREAINASSSSSTYIELHPFLLLRS